MEQIRIFISGTQDDMTSERDAVEQAVNSTILATGIRAETTLSQPKPPQAWIEEQIDKCNVYVGIYSHRYGWIIPKENISATEFEYKLARKLGKPILIWIRNVREEEKGRIDFDRQKQFLNRVSNFSTGYLRQTFDNPSDLIKWVSAALSETFAEIIRRGTESNTSNDHESIDRDANSNHYIRIPLVESGLANEDLSIYKSPPFGDYEWFGVPFHIQNARISMADTFDSQSKLLNSFNPIFGVQAVHFLINAGDGRKKHSREIGWINFVFEQDEHPQSRCLIALGKNIREWAIGNWVSVSETKRVADPLVQTVEDENSRQVWKGETHHGQVAVIDMLTVRIDSSKHSKRFLGIEFVRSIPRNTVALDYFISGITIEVGALK